MFGNIMVCQQGEGFCMHGIQQVNRVDFRLRMREKRKRGVHVSAC